MIMKVNGLSATKGLKTGQKLVIPAYAYSTEMPVEVLGAKYKWARGAGLL